MALARHSTPKRCVVFVLRAMIYFRATIRWIRFLEYYGVKYGLGAPPLDVVRKSLSTHLVHGASPDRTIALLRNHLFVAEAYFGQDLRRALWNGDTVAIARIEGKRAVYRVDLCRADCAGARHEGELTVAISDGTLPRPLFRVTFTLYRSGRGRSTVVIGGLQGSGLDDAKAAMVAATRDLGGLRPKDALLLVLKGLAARMGAQELYAVSNATHVINRRRQRRRLLKLADYDSYWQDRGGHEGAPFGYVLPIGDLHLATPAANRREAVKRRFAEIGFHLA
ncbi:DUF535 family protein [Siculibacillus lacustris]|uniref:DUF535 family protein n=1 Tax=Siculibacillus lacustris TaxID=1549641 RepID=UPI0013F154A3|nr:DUF535 family protein [Siculibacillus lacustris]